MATRIRDRWRNPGKQNSIEDSANALGYICWQLALTSARNLHAEDFIYEDDHQRVGVIQEYLAFLNHVSDRLTFDRLSETQRPLFVSALAHACASQLQRNTSEVLGSGDYRTSFIDLLNQRNADYGQCSFRDGAAGYSLLRTFGDRVKVIMGDDQTNRWVIDQVMEIDGPDLIRKLTKSLTSLLGTMPFSPDGEKAIGPG
ncbi:MAG: hypothetical protein VW546_00190 [Gammaproteobacteria bacterium]